MTLYNNRSFTVAPSGSYDQAHAMCRQHGHMEPDQRGKCLRCGERVPTPAEFHAMVSEAVRYIEETSADAEATELGRS